MTEQQKIEHLMRPRYKMIGSYPGAKTEVFDILIKHQPPGWKLPIYTTNPDNLLNGVSLKHSEVEPYDHLFKRLEWYEDRQVSEMPEYVKWHSGIILKVKDWFFDVGNEMCYNTEKDDLGWNCYSMPSLPATAQEFETYKAKADKTTEDGK